MSGPLDSIQIDKSSPVPLYHQLAGGIEAAIRSGEVPVGSFLTNEIEIAAHFGMSRPTVRQAIGELVNAGLVTRQRGVGTRVISPALSRPVALTSLHEDLAKAGRGPKTTVLKLELVRPPAELAGRFASEQVWEVERLRSTSDGPLALLHNWVLGDYDLSIEALEGNGLYAVMRSQGASLDQAVQRIGAENAPAQAAKHLGIRAGAALLTMHRETFDLSGALLEIGDHAYRSDGYYFESSIRSTQLGK
jgi:DNA-binding GntR family transcriptional regulator